MAEIGAKNDLLIIGLAEGMTLRAAAERAHMGYRTAQRRYADPRFRERIAEARRQMFDRALGLLSNAAAAAAEQLKELLSDENSNVSLGACRASSRTSPNCAAKNELAERFESLERRIEEMVRG